MIRKPEFVIIGAMKAGTTSLFRNLSLVPSITLPTVKEPHFFSRPDRWSRGLEWYESLFADCTGLTGEASTSYSDARTARLVAQRMSDLTPDVRIVYSLRDPVARMKSHYQHQVTRARESRPFPDALKGGDSEYLASSLYGEVVKAYLDYFDREQLLMFRIEDLDRSETATWQRILGHIGVEDTEMPTERHNVTAGKRQFTPVMRWLWERDLIPRDLTIPGPLRALGKRLLTKHPKSRSSLLDTTSMDVPEPVEGRLKDDHALLTRLAEGVNLAWGDL